MVSIALFYVPIFSSDNWADDGAWRASSNPFKISEIIWNGVMDNALEEDDQLKGMSGRDKSSLLSIQYTLIPSLDDIVV